jgi:tRNA-dihydrouridine synthase B
MPLMLCVQFGFLHLKNGLTLCPLFRLVANMAKIGNIELGDFPLLLAPMEDVSDPPFRAVCKEGGADLMYTEFISSEGLIRDAAKSRQKLDIFEYERPIGIQLFGGDIGNMVQSAEIATEVNPDLIDINYGCPVKAVACRGAGAALLQDIPKMVKMTEEIVKCTHLPVTVKTRLGWDDHTKNIVEVAERLQDIGIQALTIHGRTRVQMYKGSADWTLIGKIKENPRMHIPVFGNGDIDSPQKALEYKNTYGVDGVMIGRAAIGYPWIFNEIKHYLRHGERPLPPDMTERIRATKKHLDFSIQWKGDRLGIFEMRRHYTNYFKGIPDFKPFRARLVEADTKEEVELILNEVSDQYANTRIAESFADEMSVLQGETVANQ